MRGIKGAQFIPPPKRRGYSCEIWIKSAKEADIPVIEEILLDALNWLESIGSKMWVKSRITWEFLSQWIAIDEFCLAYMDQRPVGCMALTDHDPTIWEDIQKGESLFVHRLAVRREAAGQGVSKALLDYAKAQAVRRGINAVRLDCWRDREKIRAIYEREGFVCVKETFLFDHYHAALYVWQGK